MNIANQFQQICLVPPEADLPPDIIRKVKNLFKLQYAAYLTPPAIASIIQGRHNWVSLNFQIKMPAAARPTMALIIFSNIIKILYSKIQPFF